MTDDLTTLLRDAGRAPTIDVDADAVHSRGRRRAVGRRVAIGAGTLALLGVVGVGVVSLLDAPDTPIVDQAPGESAPAPGESGPTPTDEHASVGPTTTADAVTAAELAVEHGLVVHQLVFTDGAFDVVVATPSGTTSGRWLEGATQLGEPVVADDGGLWSLTPDGRTVRRDPTTEEVTVIADPGDGSTAWLPIGPFGDGRGSILVIETGIGDATLAQPSSVYVATADGVRPFTPFPALDAVAVAGDESVWSATARGEQVIALTGAGESYRVVQLPSGADGRVLLEDGGTERWLADVAMDERSAWVLGNDVTTGATLRRVSLDDGSIIEIDVGWSSPTARRVSVTPDGSVVTVTVTTEGDASRTFVVTDVTAAGATVRELVGDGLVDLLPWSGTRPAPAACADQPLNPPPGEALSVWFLCWDAADRLPQDAAHPFVHGEDRLAGADVDAGAAGLRTVLDAWAAGPTAAEAATGLTGGLDADVATIGDVRIDGSTVTVDLAPGPQVGVLGTTTGRATTVQAIVGAVLQFDGNGGLTLDEVVLTLDGSCEDWAAVAETAGCPTYAATLAPWTQG